MVATNDGVWLVEFEITTNDGGQLVEMTIDDDDGSLVDLLKYM